MSETGENTGNPGAERKKRIRAGHKAHLTKLTTAVDTLLAAYSNAQEGELLKLKGSLERKIQVIAKLDDEILDTVEDDQIDAEIEEADSCTELHRRSFGLSSYCTMHKPCNRFSKKNGTIFFKTIYQVMK